MKSIRNIISKTVVVFIAMVSFGCGKYLDVIPDNTATLDHAFGNRAAMEKYLFSCYSYLPDQTDPFYYPAYFGSNDEFDWGGSTWIRPAPTPSIGRGEQNSNNPQLNFWSGGNGATNLFQAIRNCNIFLENSHVPRDIDEAERSRWVAEVKFLKAYYHLFLLQLYGPIPLIKENVPLSATSEELNVYREPVEECVDYIVSLINEAVPDLPLVINNPTDEAGRITQPVALAVKAKALVWNASPLFNGNQDYAGWTDARNKLLISDTYSREKWERAAIAVKNAIDTCILGGHGLYVFNKLTNAQTYNMNDSLVHTMTVRKGITEKWNKGIVWSCMQVFAAGKGGISGFLTLGDFQRILFPIIYSQDVGKTVAYCYASFDMAELFYTGNGVPIDEDKDWDYAGRYQSKVSTVEARNGSYIPVGEITSSLNFDREPRFYAGLGFDRGNFELSTTTTDGGATFSPCLKLRYGDPGNLACRTGYFVKKLIAFESSCSQGSDKVYSGTDYRFPIIRLADLYLLYSEALNEIGADVHAENDPLFQWIDEVRATTGLSGVVESWKQHSKYSDRPLDKTEMRKIIQQERMIELAFEGQRFWDVRRWKLADKLWTNPLRGWYQQSNVPGEYYTPVLVAEARKFFFKDYLWPIRISDLRVNTNLVQTYGW
ncbi:MAG: RagB/SusD family nutrient uptake outer membrane protein [Bacteroidales bacterium]|jgi:hypothetical protein|nr:RagB/SusD family nutrient uptake outer membrane protein [Bacteroidales bacterium]